MRSFESLLWGRIFEVPRKVKRCDDLDSSVQCFDKCYLQKKGEKFIGNEFLSQRREERS